MKAIHRKLLLVVLPLAPLGCAGRTPPSAPTVTSAPIEADSKAELARLRAERDEARAQAMAERQRRGFAQLVADERANFMKRAWTKLDEIDASIRALQGAKKDKAKLDEALDRRAQIDHELRGVLTVPEDWLERLETEIDLRIDELSRLVAR